MLNIHDLKAAYEKAIGHATSPSTAHTLTPAFSRAFNTAAWHGTFSSLADTCLNAAAFPGQLPTRFCTIPLWDGPPLSKRSSRIVDLYERERSGPMDIVVLGVDLGKNLYSVAGLDASGRVVLRRRMKRETFVAFAQQWPSYVVAMEACCGAHHLGRQMAAQGHEVRLMSPEYVRPYVKAQKNDDRDAEAIAEAATRPTMQFVALKTETQLEVQVLHRVRDRLVGDWTALTN